MRDIADRIENMSQAEFDYWEEQVERKEHPERFSMPTTTPALWVPMDVQPPEGWRPKVGRYRPAVVDESGMLCPGPEVYGVSDEDFGATPPYKLGDVVELPEIWTVCDVAEMTDEGDTVTIAYKRDQNAMYWPVSNDEYRRMKQLLQYLEVCGDGGDNWQPASTMPAWAIRKRTIAAEGVPELREGTWGWRF